MLGVIYGLVAVGFTLFFGVLDVIKFSHGDVLTVGAFTALAAFLALQGVGLSSHLVELAAMLVAAVLAMALLGVLIARYLVMPLRSAPALNTLLATLMLGTVLRETVRLFYPGGANPKPFPALLPGSAASFGHFTLRLDNALMLAAGVIVIVGLQLMLQKTKLGLAIRAVAQDEETARTMGVNFTAVVLATFAIGSALAAFAGLMNGLYYNEINFGIGLLLGVIGFSAAIIGGLGSIYGAILAVLAAKRLGLLESVGRSFAEREDTLGALAILGALAVAAWFYDNHFVLLLLNGVLLYAVATLGLNLQFGYAGVLNFAGASFFGIGAYTSSVLIAHTAVPHLLVLPIGGFLAALVGSLLVVPVLRTRGHYAAVVTIAFALLFKTFLEVNDVLGGPQGMQVGGMKILGWSFNDNIELGRIALSFYMSYFVMSMVLLVGAFILVRRLERSWIGLNIDSLR